MVQPGDRVRICQNIMMCPAGRRIGHVHDVVPPGPGQQRYSLDLKKFMLLNPAADTYMYEQALGLQS
jgi:hypothetical protein